MGSVLTPTAKLSAASEELERFTFKLSAKFPLHLLLRAAGTKNDWHSCLQESKDSVAVRVALGETELVQEIRRFLIENGVSLDSFSQVRCPAGGSDVDLFYMMA